LTVNGRERRDFATKMKKAEPNAGSAENRLETHLTPHPWKANPMSHKFWNEME
jgi:hypothetical protein